MGFGWLVGLYGAQAFLFAPLAVAIGALCIWLSLKMMQPKDDAITVG